MGPHSVDVWQRLWRAYARLAPAGGRKRVENKGGKCMHSPATGRIGIIGGGLGGLAAACTLAARRYDVVLFEGNAWLGGGPVTMTCGCC